jgi:protein involved in polysaccharide export with SLBB domain
MQLLGDVQASGLTTSQLREYLRDSFSKYVRVPVVSVIVTESHSKMVHVIGRVANPRCLSSKQTVNGYGTVGPGRRLR